MNSSAATNSFTNMTAEELRASMSRFEGLSVMATTNEDGTPNAAIFVPTMPDNTHIMLMLAQNNTRSNLERTGKAHLVYDVPNPQAPTKEERHAGARLELELVRQNGEDSEEFETVAKNIPNMNPAVMILRIKRILPVG